MSPLAVEKRKFNRVEAHVPISFRLLKSVDQREPQELGLSRDLSLGGLGLASPVELHPADLLKVEIIDQLERPVSTHAEVAWVRKIEDGFLAGVKFLSMRNSESEKLLNFISSQKAA